eukprot:TRINITY_DN8796_c0_g1_i3.p1 TRINITY_DN8796_c0_g1~~TRINITY_DN8796_c0_g1_i3.p1  ORF type:complete len:113 (+),score=33.72 TRINITY_DN8796_c0_g1_i3:2-340(+)
MAISSGINAEYMGEGIRCAAENGYLDVVDRLLQVPGVDATADDNYAIRMAAKNGHVAVVERLLRDERVVVKLGLAPQVVHDSSTRLAVAMAQCAAANPEFETQAAGSVSSGV